MENKIRKILSKYNGTFGVIIKDSFGNRVAINEDKVFLSASIITVSYTHLTLPTTSRV